LKAEELTKAGKKLYGERGWKEKLADALAVDSSSVRRWVSGSIPVPGPVAAAVRCFLRNQRLTS
jgi:hypothetical protein